MTRNLHKNPNPQGKGLVAVLADWQATRPSAVERKAPGDLLRDWFASALVLSADFHFRPVVGQSYYLYHRADGWRLSLIAPQEWGRERSGACLGCCRLQPDMTWSLEPREELADEGLLVEELARLVAAFAEELADEGSLAARVPGYRRDLPYHRRMLATALGSSLRLAVDDASRLDAPARDLLEAAGGLSARALLAPGVPPANPAQRVS
ncbi:MAG: DUF2452 domain-containing protein [Halieaceae bacterium]|jgi:hypothetical protein|nr:DUF2452 domain-containing protein [Halieaceae bacterium]